MRAERRAPFPVPMMVRPIRSSLASRWVLVVLAALPALEGRPLRAQAAPPPLPAAEALPVAGPSAPADPEALPVWNEAQRATGRRILVSLAERRLWLMEGSTTLHSARVAVGKPVILEYEDQTWNFATPRGRREVLGKQANPVWVPPDWHYVELAMAQGWKLEVVRRDRPVPLGDGSSVVVRGRRIGRLTPEGSFVPVPPGEEAVFDGTLFVPPLDTENRRIPGELGRFKLDLGDAYYLHGTPYPESVGSATTHGCIRLLDEDLEYLYRTVAVGTPVFLY